MNKTGVPKDPRGAQGGLDSHLEAAYDALEAGQPEEALVEAGASSDAEGRALAESRAYLELGLLRASRAALGRAASTLGADSLDVLELSGEIALAGWELEDSIRAFSRVLEDSGEEDPYILERLALLADLQEEPTVADALMARAGQADPEAAPQVRMEDEEFDRQVEGALASLDPRFREHVAATRVVRELVPSRSMVDPSQPAATPPDILGLFVGPTIQDERAEGELPPTIYLFKRNLERMARDAEHLAEEIRVTLFHEIGHLLGLDEDGVAAMGLA